MNDKQLMNEDQPEPVTGQALIVALAVTLIQLFMSLGVWNLDESQYGSLVNFIKIAVTVVFIYGGARWARNRVTPVSSPQAENTEGKIVPLIPADGSTLKK